MKPYQDFVDIVQNASTYLINYRIIRLIYEGYEKEKITKDKAIDYISRVIKEDKTWLEEEDAKSLFK